MPAGSSSPIVDQWGRPMRADASEISSVHRAASRSSQEMSTWLPPLTSADGGWIRERNQVAARIHDAVINNGWASGVVTRHVDQAIGARFRLSSRPDYRALGMDFETARQWALETESKFRNWATDPRRYCDAGEHLTLSQLLSLIHI